MNLLLPFGSIVVVGRGHPGNIFQSNQNIFCNEPVLCVDIMVVEGGIYLHV
jgi:hypothetical protein